MEDLAATVHARLDALEAAVHRKFDALLQGVHHLIEKGTDMTKAHDDLLAAAKDADSQADALIAAKSSGDGKLSDILAVVNGTRDKLTAAVKADADDEEDDTSGQANGAQSIGAATQQIDPATGQPIAG